MVAFVVFPHSLTPHIMSLPSTIYGAKPGLHGTMIPSVINRIQKHIPAGAAKTPAPRREGTLKVPLLLSQIPSSSSSFPEHSSFYWGCMTSRLGASTMYPFGKNSHKYPYLCKIQVCWFGNKVKQEQA